MKMKWRACPDENETSAPDAARLYRAVFLLHVPAHCIHDRIQSKGYSLFTGFTLKWYSSLLHNSSILHALLVSLEVALISAVIATVLGTAASLGIASMGLSLIHI